VNYPGRLSPSVTHRISTAVLQTMCWQCVSVGDRLICGSWILDVFSASKSGPTYVQIALRRNIR